ncbi:MAG: uroporphyrin-III C-methyltransferase, partial [Moorea sp. SIO3I7]|nr:uroporphyrin-III C-methyltransferase [Moorena sp. SIO3I7]
GTLETIVAQVEETQFSAPAIAVIGNVVKLQQLEGFSPLKVEGG